MSLPFLFELFSLSADFPFIHLASSRAASDLWPGSILYSLSSLSAGKALTSCVRDRGGRDGHTSNGWSLYRFPPPGLTVELAKHVSPFWSKLYHIWSNKLRWYPKIWSTGPTGSHHAGELAAKLDHLTQFCRNVSALKSRRSSDWFIHLHLQK